MYKPHDIKALGGGYDLGVEVDGEAYLIDVECECMVDALGLFLPPLIVEVLQDVWMVERYGFWNDLGDVECEHLSR